MTKWLLSITLFVFLPIYSVKADEQETPHLKFVRTYIQQLGALEHIRDEAAQELKVNGGADSLPDCIRNMTRYQLELGSQIETLKSMHLKPPFETLVSGIEDFDTQKLELYKKISDICSTLIAGPKGNVDYGELAADAPKINALIEFIDKALFKLSPMIFATLIDQKPDAENHLSHMIITKAEKQDLVRDIELEFGEKLKQKDQNYIVGAASVIEHYLKEKGYKCSDEP
jgi:hypothetical protein